MLDKKFRINPKMADALEQTRRAMAKLSEDLSPVDQKASDLAHKAYEDMTELLKRLYDISL